MPFPPLIMKKNALWLLDQRKLPGKETWIICRDSRRVHWAIKEMVVRGAPAIGIAAGYGLYLAMLQYRGNYDGWVKRLGEEGEYLKSARPTGVNLRNVIDGISAKVRRTKTTDCIILRRNLLREAGKVHKEDDKKCRAIGRYGAKLVPNKAQILTHCNAGGLATSGYGTALGVIYGAVERGKKVFVYADETRPLLQGARLTAWELVKSGIPAKLICDNMAASIMRAGKVDLIVVGADRIAGNGDTANKIGTYNLAVLAKYHRIPFYIAAPSTTFDFQIKTGRDIPIEYRHDSEVTVPFGKAIAPEGIQAENPAFDVTPFSLISAFVTETGVLKPPYRKSFQKIKRLQAES